MRIFVYFGDYPHTVNALRETGATIVPSISEAEGFVFTQTPGTDFSELNPGSGGRNFRAPASTPTSPLATSPRTAAGRTLPVSMDDRTLKPPSRCCWACSIGIPPWCAPTAGHPVRVSTPLSP